MNATTPSQTATPPQLFVAMLQGFDKVANHFELVLFPIALDVLIWLGPHLPASQLWADFQKQIEALPSTQLPVGSGVSLADPSVWQEVAARFNLMTALRAFPVGVPSLMAGRLPILSPVGQPAAWDVGSLGFVVAVWAALSLVGLALGTFFYQLVAQASLTGEVAWVKALREWFWSARQVLGLALLFLALIVAIGVPASCILSISVLAGVGQCTIFAYSGILLWMLFPLFLSAHGIFVNQDRVFASVFNSIRLSRVAVLPLSVMFLLIILMTQGLDLLWNVTREDSWLSLFGIVGHAFVTTGLLAGTFRYYRDLDRWVKVVSSSAPTPLKTA